MDIKEPGSASLSFHPALGHVQDFLNMCCNRLTKAQGTGIQLPPGVSVTAGSMGHRDEKFSEFEDSVLHEAAKQIGVQGIVTRSPRDFKEAILSIYSPEELYKMLVSILL